MTAGTLNQRITVQRRQAGQDGYGQETTAWVDVCTVWAAAEPLRGREQFLAQQAQSQADMRFVLRYRADIDAAMRVLWRGTPYGITAPPVDVKGARQWLEIMATSGVRDGG